MTRGAMGFGIHYDPELWKEETAGGNHNLARRLSVLPIQALRTGGPQAASWVRESIT